MEKRNKVDYSARIKTRFPNFEKEWRKLVREVGTDLVNFLKEKLSSHSNFFNDLTSFKFKIIVDNNFVLGQIKGAIGRNEVIEKSLLYRLLKSKSVEVFAPPLLEKELRDKIENTIDPCDHELALAYSKKMLERINIKDAQWVEDWKRANNLIGSIDRDDVPYLALALEVGSHAIISRDQIFSAQGDVRVWHHGDTDRIITNYNSGFISLALMGGTSDLLSRLFAVIFKLVRDAILTLVGLLVQLAQGAITAIMKMPPAILIMLLAFGIVFWDDIAKTGKNLRQFLIEKGREIISRLKVVISEIVELISKVLDIARLSATIAAEFLGFLLTEFNSLNAQVNELKLDELKTNLAA